MRMMKRNVNLGIRALCQFTCHSGLPHHTRQIQSRIRSKKSSKCGFKIEIEFLISQCFSFNTVQPCKTKAKSCIPLMWTSLMTALFGGATGWELFCCGVFTLCQPLCLFYPLFYFIKQKAKPVPKNSPKLFSSSFKINYEDVLLHQSSSW